MCHLNDLIRDRGAPSSVEMLLEVEDPAHAPPGARGFVAPFRQPKLQVHAVEA